MAWTNNNATKTTATVAWADETRAAITIADGLTTTGTSAGATIAIAAPNNTLTSTQYAVFCSWQEDPGNDSGEIYVVKSTGSFVIKNSGSVYTKSIYYRAVVVKSV